MLNKDRLQKLILLLGDLVIFQLALWATIAIRYASEMNTAVWLQHFVPFTIVSAIWIVIFYAFGLYDFKLILPQKGLRQLVMEVMIISGSIAMALFYLVPFFITPKTNLLIVVLLSAAGINLWRHFFSAHLIGARKINTLFIGTLSEEGEIIDFLKNNPQLGYNVLTMLLNSGDREHLETISANRELSNVITEYKIDLIVVSQSARNAPRMIDQLYAALTKQITVIDAARFYESVTGKIPVHLINESWFIDNLTAIDKKMFESAKRLLDIFGAIILGVPTIAILPLIAIIIKLDSKGPIFYSQKRTGQGNKEINIFKLRSMRTDAERDGAKWAEKNDDRITRVGGILRKTRIDELPQLWNVLRGELSFIGPRPERPEFVETLKKEIPHYEMRHLVKPGLSGWAQVNFPYGASVEDANQKMQYDLYYLKNRSLTLDADIALRTIATILRRAGQ
jgi:sugar transferase (PEP-CTERM system associated)